MGYPNDVLLLGKRPEHLADYKREPRSYNKRGTDYWNAYMHRSRAKQAKVCIEVPDDDSVSGDIRISDMTADEIKVHLKDTGVTTRLRSLKKLKELLLNTLGQDEIPTASP